MIITSGNETTNPKIPGKILVGFECVRPLSISEIRNHTGDINQNLLFYLEILGTEIHSGGFSLKKYEKAKLLGKDYSICWVRYSFKETTELMREFSDQFSYLSIFDSECVVSDYHDLLFKLQKKKTGFMQRKAGNFIRRKSLPKLLNSLRKAYSYQETKNLKEFLSL